MSAAVRLSIAGLLHAPGRSGLRILVLADEPTGELDAGNEQQVLDALRQLRDLRGSAVVLVTHSSRVAGAADRVVEMRDGQVIG